MSFFPCVISSIRRSSLNHSAMTHRPTILCFSRPTYQDLMILRRKRISGVNLIQILTFNVLHKHFFHTTWKGRYSSSYTNEPNKCHVSYALVSQQSVNNELILRHPGNWLQFNKVTKINNKKDVVMFSVIPRF